MTALKAIDIKAELAGLPALRARNPGTPADEVRAAFAVLAPFRDGSIFAGRFDGETPWERHRNGCGDLIRARCRPSCRWSWLSHIYGLRSV